jgi:hypothetical protein
MVNHENKSKVAKIQVNYGRDYDALVIHHLPQHSCSWRHVGYHATLHHGEARGDDNRLAGEKKTRRSS